MVKASLVMLLLLLPGLALAATDIRTVEAEGTGADREQAIFSALGEAVRQVRGAEISASRQVQSALSRISVRSSDGRESSVEISKASESRTRVDAEGLISGYSVQSVADAAGGGKIARLTVKIPVYKTPGNPDDGRWRMAVYPVWPARSSYQVGDLSLSREEVSSRLTQSITEALVQSRRFAMLARDRERSMIDERARMSGDDIPVSEKAMLGNQLGAEYLVSAQVTEFSFDAKEVESRLTGERSVVQTGALVLETRVLVPATGAIVWSDTLNLSSDQLGVDFDGSKRALQDLFENAGQEVALSVIDVVWPPIVESRQGDELIVNMGGELMKTGQRWDVFALGGGIKSSQSGKNLGRAESMAGTVEIVRSTPKMAYAKVIEGAVGGSSSVYVLRRPERAKDVDPDAAIRGTRKRTCLPIDPC